MHEKLLETYTELMESLAHIADEFLDVEEDIRGAKQQMREAQKQLEAIEHQIIDQAGGWAGLGRNDGDRKHNLAMKLANNNAYLRWQRILEDTQDFMDNASAKLADLERRFSAIRHQARLHAALLNYMASAGAVIIPQSRNGNGVTVDDAAEIGL